jgi:nucleotide-binding universal stress UspA family protein
MEVKKILIVADDNPPSIKAVQFGFNLARNLGAKAALLTVIEPGTTIGSPDAGIFPDDALAAIKARAHGFLERMKWAYAHSVETELEVIVGEIIPIVIKVVNDYGANLIVTGTHGHTGLSRLFTGSVAESIT